ncbi:cytochrome P450 [Qaidamihabitans albus]|uniref:cytochrome P450 n=1 Tax=Qaidamihabitans albus TaxID=2795733 RepID=UPI0018F160CC|nr:cytochrome P450 [Qaidamihabitans albus]
MRSMGKLDIAGVVAKVAAGTAVDEASAALGARYRRDHLPAGVTPTAFHQMDPAVLDDPYPSYRELLRGGPVHYNPRRHLWILSHHQHVREAAKSDRVLSSAEGVARSRFSLPMMLTRDRPEHTRMRQLAIPAFTRRALESWQPVIDELAAELVGELAAARGGDAVKQLAVPLPIRVIAHILGIPPEDYARFRLWSDKAVQATDIELRPAALKKSGNVLAGLLRLHSYFHERMAAGRLLESGTVLGRLVDAAEGGDIDPDELFWFAILLLLAGHETTTNLIGGLVHSLAVNPDQYELLRERPDLIPSAVEEQLRFGTPIQGFYRTALQDYEVESATIPRGGRVLLLFAAANRDPRQFTDPDSFVVERNPTSHVSFGYGVHMCLGAQLARMEGQAVLRELVGRAGRIEITGKPVWKPNSTLRGLDELPVRLGVSGPGQRP